MLIHLMLSSATIEAPQMDFHNAYNLTRRLQFVDEVKREFWHKWRAIVFQGLDRSYKWRQSHRDSQVGDVVLLKDETAAGNTYKLASVTKVFRDDKDGRVRKVLVAYKNVTEKVFRVSTRPIHKIVLVVPAEDADLPALSPPGGPQPALSPPGGPPVDKAALPPPGGPQPALSPPGGPPVDQVALPPPGGPLVDQSALPPLAGPQPALSPPGGPPVDQVALPPPAGPLVDQAALPPPAGPQPALSPPGGPPVDQAALPPPGGPPVVPADAEPTDEPAGDRTMRGRLRPRRTFYSWDLLNRMKKT
jgi:Family of unknown function (DUF5641)